MKQFSFYLLLLSIVFASCTDDNTTINDEDLPNSYTVTMDKGPYANQTFILTDDPLIDKINYKPSVQMTILSTDGLKEKNANRLKSTSYINFAFKGGLVPGNYSAIKLIDTVSNQIGNLDLYFSNTDEIIITIFKGAPIKITEYGDVKGRIKGNIIIKSPIDFQTNNKPGFVSDATIKVDFDLKRGADIQ